MAQTGDDSHGVRRVDDVQALQDRVGDAVVGVEDPRPQERDDHAGDEPGDEQRAAQDPLALDPRIEGEGEAEPDDEWADRRSDREDKGV